MKTGKNHHLWKGDSVGYSVLHRWVQKCLGIASICSTCFTSLKEARIEWANLSGEYKRELDDWLPMCRSCHMTFDDVSRRVWQTRRKKYGKTGHKKTANWKGWKHSLESRRKMSETRKGRVFSKQHKKNLSKSIKKYWKRRKQND
jgi:hypothetical protein